MNKVALILVMPVLLTLSASVSAQPDLQFVEGEWQAGTTLILHGDHFGNKAHAAPLVWDTLANQPAYSGLSHGDEIPTGDGYPWRGNGSPWSQTVFYSTQDERVSGRPYYSVHTKGFLRGYNYGAPEQFFVSWWFRSTIPPSGWAQSSSKLNRFIANETTSVVEHNDSYCVWWGLGMAIVLGPTSTENVWNSCGFQPDQWHHLEMVCDSRDLAGSMAIRTGKVRAWRDRVAVHDTTFPGINPVAEIYVLGFDPSVTEPYADDLIDFGEVYIDTTQARVVAANSPVFATASHTENQIPVVWNNNMIEASANTGSFLPGESVWLYVIDRDGRPSPTGVEITPASEAPGQPGSVTMSAR